MSLDESKIIEGITKLTQESQNQQLRLFARVDLEIKLQVIRQQISIFHTLKEKYRDVDKVVLSFSSHILAIDSVLGKLDNITINASKLCSRGARVSSKREKIISYWAILRSLKLEQKMSFRQISGYLKKYHKLSVAHSTIATIWNDLEQNTPLK